MAFIRKYSAQMELIVAAALYSKQANQDRESGF